MREWLLANLDDPHQARLLMDGWWLAHGGMLIVYRGEIAGTSRRRSKR